MGTQSNYALRLPSSLKAMLGARNGGSATLVGLIPKTV